jgi:hypothetical protein
VVSCNEDGSCGEIDWVCEEEPPPNDAECPSLCAVPAICQLCDDESCAEPAVSCNEDGSCGDISWECPPAKTRCETNDDCFATVLVACRQCENGSESCPEMGCVEGECVLEYPECVNEVEYDPCAEKEPGAECSLCAPGDEQCIETDEIKTCQEGECLPQVQ